MTNGLNNHPVDIGPGWVGMVVWGGMMLFGPALISLAWVLFY